MMAAVWHSQPQPQGAVTREPPDAVADQLAALGTAKLG